jgi:signal peptidase I
MKKWWAVGLVALGAILVSRFDVVRVSENSMAGTYCDGDLLLAWGGSSGSLRGQVVVVDHPVYGRVAKRVLAEAGDTILVRDGLAIVNGRENPEGYVGCRSHLAQIEAWWARAGFEKSDLAMVPTGEIYILGDNRAASVDSRIFGTVRRDRVLDVVLARLYRNNSAPCAC